MHDGESSIDSRKRITSDLRVDDSHSYVAQESKGAREDETAVERRDAPVHVEPFPFSRVSPNARKQIEIQVGETMIAESRLNQLRRGDVVDLDTAIDEDVIVWCDGRQMARGKLVVANGRLAVLLAEKPNFGDGVT